VREDDSAGQEVACWKGRRGGLFERDRWVLGWRWGVGCVGFFVGGDGGRGGVWVLVGIDFRIAKEMLVGRRCVFVRIRAIIITLRNLSRCRISIARFIFLPVLVLFEGRFIVNISAIVVQLRILSRRPVFAGSYLLIFLVLVLVLVEVRCIVNISAIIVQLRILSRRHLFARGYLLIFLVLVLVEVCFIVNTSVIIITFWILIRSPLFARSYLIFLPVLILVLVLERFIVIRSLFF
jgi:hypothetical protein